MSLAVIVPTRNEAANVSRLINALSAHAPGGTRVIFVDDSCDDGATARALTIASRTATNLEVYTVHRPENERNGLSGAVIDGLELAQADTFALVIDADLQHPPAIIPRMLAALEETDIVVASRYCPGGSASGLNGPARRAVSIACSYLAQWLFPLELRSVSDPMSGCFAVRTGEIDTGQLQSEGFKILLELLVSHPHLRRAEVPIRFDKRDAGASKSNLKIGWQFLRQLYRLRSTLAPSVSTEGV